ncbi:MAG: penicillin-binding transpeptidase domain-containing protein, partial [Novosphingobium sp.]
MLDYYLMRIGKAVSHVGQTGGEVVDFADAELGGCLAVLTSAYAVVAADGFQVRPYGIVRIKTRDGGETLYRSGNRLADQVLSDNTVMELREMLGAVMTSGTGKAAQIGLPAGGKTGTSQDFKDAW